jgi:hypothetical protein
MKRMRGKEGQMQPGSSPEEKGEHLQEMSKHMRMLLLYKACCKRKSNMLKLHQAKIASGFMRGV